MADAPPFLLADVDDFPFQAASFGQFLLQHRLLFFQLVGESLRGQKGLRNVLAQGNRLGKNKKKEAHGNHIGGLGKAAVTENIIYGSKKKQSRANKKKECTVVSVDNAYNEPCKIIYWKNNSRYES